MSTAIYSHPDCLRHEMGDWHPESPARLQAIDDQLILARLDGLLEQRSAPLAASADILRNHTPSAVALVRVDPARAEEVLEDLAQLFRVALADAGTSVTLDEEIDLAQRSGRTTRCHRAGRPSCGSRVCLTNHAFLWHVHHARA